METKKDNTRRKNRWEKVRSTIFMLYKRPGAQGRRVIGGHNLQTSAVNCTGPELKNGERSTASDSEDEERVRRLIVIIP